MSPNPLWTTIKFTASFFIPTCMGLAHSSTLNTPKIDYSPFFLQTHIHWPIYLSLPSLVGWHWNACFKIHMQCLRLFFSAEPIASGFTTETHPCNTDLPGVTTTRQLAPFSKSFYRLPIGSFLIFTGPLIPLVKTPLKCLVSCFLTFQRAVLNFQSAPIMLVSLKIL